MIRFPVYNTYRNKFRAMAQNLTKDKTSVYSHMLWTGYTVYAFSEEKGSVIAWKLKRPSIVADLLGENPVMLDLDAKHNLIVESDRSVEDYNLEYVMTVTAGSEELERKVLPTKESVDNLMHAIREYTEGKISMKQLAPMKRIKCYVLIKKCESITLIAEDMKIHIRHRKVWKPRISTGYIQYLADYPKNGRVFI